jgi:EpsI family protein
MPAAKRSILAALIAVAFVATYAFTRAAAMAPLPEPPALAAFPLSFAGWEGAEAPELAPEVAEVLAADYYLHRYYEGEPGVIEMDVAYYNQRRVGASMHSPLNCLPGNGWTITDTRMLPIETAAGTFLVQELTVKRRTSIFALAYWYQNRDRILTGETSTRFRLLADSLQGRPADVGLVRVMTRLSGENGQERDAVAAFAAVLIPELASSWRSPSVIELAAR